MENEFLDKVEDNAAVRVWSERMQLEKGNSIADGYVSELWDFTRINTTQNDFGELKKIWNQWDDKTKQLFYHNYGDLPYLFDIKLDKHLFRAMTQFWNPAYSCFTFGKVDLVPTVEEYTTLLNCPRARADKVYFKAANAPTFVKKLMNITGMDEQWVSARIQKKGEGKCIPWLSLKDLILTHPDVKKKIGVFALCIYGLVIFPKALRHIDEAVTDLVDRLDKGITPVPAILAETFRSLNACRKMGEGRFIGCAQLLLVWFHSHFWKMEKVSRHVFFENHSPLKKIVATPRKDDIPEENWMTLLQNLQEEDVEWRAPWMIPKEILYRCGNFDWVPLLGIWGAVGYAPLIALRQYGSRQFIPMTSGLAQSEFAYSGESYKKRAKEMSGAWNQVHKMKRLSAGPMTTPEYDGWRTGRVNDNVPEQGTEGSRLREECLRVVPSELEIIKQDFERQNLALEKRIEKLEEEKIYLKLDVDVQKSETERVKKEKRKVEEDRDNLKTEYKKMRLSIKNAGLGKTSEQWQQEVQEGRARTDFWERKFREMRTRKETLEKDLAESLNERIELKDKIIELGRTLHHCRSRNTAIELKLSLSRIEEMKNRVEELEAALHSYELRVELLEAKEERGKEEIHHSHDQIRNRNYLMSEAIVQIREVADYLQTLAAHADVLSVRYELQPHHNQELISLLSSIKALGLRAKAYL
ncbi:227 kDa spindle and centromere-associated protein-like protein [Gossypium australe]|uniref:227 kDa spindle and centromere-associated protein-like protein n=1 Tax=Gossypium australe TaxID=47621 RepID=A0A5B6WHG4_9ROSI|nr:227 kDa spindle and centromere-associated protein-like protein [Gossypium australe]